jgi:abequosyltransferase
MNYENIILSICIATYNREKYIQETLNSIIPQILNKNIEIILVDGASTDSTNAILLNYSNEYSQIRYFRLDEKGGVDKDYSISVEHARGKYCWLFTDDDLIRPYSIERILEYIKSDFLIYIVNSEVRNIDFSKLISPNRLQLSSDKDFTENQIDDLFKCIVPYVSFIGCVIIKREFWNVREKSKYFGTEFVHVGVIFQDHIPGICQVISEPLITIRFGNAQWTERAFEIWMFKWPNLLSSFFKISLSLRENFNQAPSFSNFKKFLIFRSDGVYDFSGFKNKISNLDLPLWWKLVLSLVSLVPIFLIRIPINIYVRIHRILHEIR